MWKLSLSQPKATNPRSSQKAIWLWPWRQGISEGEIDGVNNNDLATWSKALYEPKTLGVHLAEQHVSGNWKYMHLFYWPRATLSYHVPNPSLHLYLILSCPISRGLKFAVTHMKISVTLGRWETQTFMAHLDSDSQVSILPSPLGELSHLNSANEVWARFTMKREI